MPPDSDLSSWTISVVGRAPSWLSADMDPDHGAEHAEERRDAQERLQMLDALVAAAARKDEVFQLVGQAQNTDEAVRAVRDLLHVEDMPAAAVVDLQLRNFTVEQQRKLRATRDALRTRLERPH